MGRGNCTRVSHRGIKKKDMKITIQTPSVELGESLIFFVREKVGKLGDISDRIVEIRVILQLSAADIRRNKICEIIVIFGKELVVQKQAATFKEAVIVAIEVVRKQIIEKCKTAANP